MAFQVSPGVNISEVDLTTGVQTASLSVGAFVGAFAWGPALVPISVGSESDLVAVFGKPDSTNYEYWFSAQSFLTYSSQLRVVRAISTSALNATAEAKTLTGTVTTNGTVTIIGSGTAFDDELVAGQTLVVNAELLVVNTVTNATQITVVTAPASGNVSGGAAKSYGALIKNEAQWEQSFSNGVTGFGFAASKWPGELGSSLKVSVCPSADAFEDTTVTGDSVTANASLLTVTGVATTFTSQFVAGDLLVLLDSNGREADAVKIASITNATSLTLATEPAVSGVFTTGDFYRRWEYASQFDAAPGTSAYADAKGASTDEMHIVVVDEDGLISGVRGTVLEKYAFASKASDAKDDSGNNNYYVNRLNRESAYVWWLSHVGTTTSWGTVASSGKTFGSSSLPYTKSLEGASNGATAGVAITSGNLQTGWDVFADPDLTDVSLLIAGPADPRTDGVYIINNVAEARKDAIAFLSPRKASVVNNPLDEVSDITTDRGSINSSYAVMDSGWKYTYDKFNDVYRWVPLNGDIAGLAARTDNTNDPWWSPAGFTRGNIKNVVKLAWNPKQLQRDDLYKIGVNPVVSFPAQGVVLYGDKTLLTRPSAFDRINVRRLFIALEKTIARYAKAQLFEFNDEFTRSSFRNAVEPFLRDVKARRGVTDYLVICDSTNNPAQVVDANQFVGSIFVKPTRSINFIQLNFVAVRTGVSFQEVIGSV